jgi:hypothetical protein
MRSKRANSISAHILSLCDRWVRFGTRGRSPTAFAPLLAARFSVVRRLDRDMIITQHRIYASITEIMK